MRCEFSFFENGQSDNVGDNKTPSAEDDADAREAITRLDTAQAGLLAKGIHQVTVRPGSNSQYLLCRFHKS
jgi:hypothetical protein